MLTSSDVLNHSFTSTSFRRGYDEFEVDEFLDELVETLRYYERGGQPPREVPASHVLPDPEALESPTPSDPETLGSATPSDPETLESPAPSDPGATQGPAATGQRTSEDQRSSDPEPLEPATASDPEPLEPAASPVPDGTETTAPSALPVMVSPTSRKYIERAQRASRWLREDPLP
ncbi:hypothetical protein GCM10027053_32480 [Intrasporangium mesophilum]